MPKYSILTTVPGTKNLVKGKTASVAPNVAIYFRYLATQASPEKKAIAISNEQIIAIAEGVSLDDYSGDEHKHQDEIVRQLLVADGQIADTSETEEDESEETEETGETEPTEEEKKLPIEKQDDIDKEATKLMRKAIDDKPLNAMFSRAVEIDDEALFMPLKMRDRFIAVYGIEGMNELPMPGTTKNTAGNHAPDKRLTRVKRQGGDGWRDATVSIVDRMAELLPEAAKHTATLSAIANRSTEKNEWQNATIDKIGKATKKAKAALVTIKRNFRRTLTLHHQLALCQALPDVDVYYGKEKDGSATQDRVPIVVKNKLNDDVREYFTVVQFNALEPADCRDPLKLKKNDGSVYLTLIRSAARGTGQRTKKGMCPPITIFNQGDAALSEVAHWLEKKETEKAIFDTLNKGKPEESNDLLASVFAIFSALKPFTDDPALRKRHQEYEVLRNRAEKEQQKTAA